LRLETAAHIDKKKSEFYFSSHIKKILTEKSKRAWSKTAKMVPAWEVDSERVRELTGSAHTRIFAPFEARFALAPRAGDEFETN
jgi:hypothetical protein